MQMINKNASIKYNYKEHLTEIANRHLPLFVIPAVAITVWFAYSDVFIRENINAFYTRIATIILGATLIAYHYSDKKRNKSLKFTMYSAFIISGLLMMYAKYIVYLYSGDDNNSVTGIVVLIFIVALELKVNQNIAIATFFGPLLLLVTTVVFIKELPQSKVINFTNLFPMTIIGFVANRVQYNLRYRLFESNYWLNQEKIHAKELYEETLSMNEYLQEKNEEIEVQKELIEKSNVELKKISQTKDKFLSIISHDLKTPFNAIIGFTDLLTENYNQLSEDERKNYIATIDESSKSTYRLLTNLLEWSQTQKDDHQLRLETLNLFLLVNDIITYFKLTAENKKIDLINNIKKDMEIRVDANKLQTIMRNLISNAIKFTFEGGSVSIDAMYTDNDINRGIEITVTDTGIGISSEHLDNLFKINHKRSSLGTNKETGTGLGLFLCQEYIQRHNGTIRIESKVNEGSKFIFVIPQNISSQLPD